MTSGGTSVGAAPTSSDAVTFDGAGTFGNTNCTITATAAAASVTFTSGYTALLTINSNITWTVSGNFTDNTAHTYSLPGTQNAGQLTINATSTINSGGMTFPGNVTFSVSSTKTLLTNNWIISGTLTCSTTTTTINHTTSETLSVGGLAINNTTTGSAATTITGGTWTGTGTNTLTSLTLAGTITVSGAVNYGSGTLTYSSGTITTTGSTLTLSGNNTLNTNPVIWNNITINTASATTTINSLLSCTGTLSMNANGTETFAGTSGWSCATFSQTVTANGTITLVNGVTYTITTAFNCFNSRIGAIQLFTSDSGSVKAILTLQNAATTCNVLASFTRIDASGGRPIVTFNGTLTTCINIYSQTNVAWMNNILYQRGRRRKSIADRNNAVTFNNQ